MAYVRIQTRECRAICFLHVLRYRICICLHTICCFQFVLYKILAANMIKKNTAVLQKLLSVDFFWSWAFKTHVNYVVIETVLAVKHFCIPRNW